MTPLLCRDCRFCRPSLDMGVLPSPFFWNYAHCTHPSSWHPGSLDPVSGRRNRGWWAACRAARAGEWNDLCGPAGRWWQAATPAQRWRRRALRAALPLGLLAIYGAIFVVTLVLVSLALHHGG